MKFEGARVIWGINLDLLDLLMGDCPNGGSEKQGLNKKRQGLRWGVLFVLFGPLLWVQRGAHRTSRAIQTLYEHRTTNGPKYGCDSVNSRK